MQEVLGSIIGGHQILEGLGASGRFYAFRVKLRGPNAGLGRLYLLGESLMWPERFHETVHLVHSRYPFALADQQRALILPEPQLWDARPWFVVPEGHRILGSSGTLTHAALESLRGQLRWLAELSIARPGITSGPLSHGDTSLDRILILNDSDARLIAPAWVAATELALQRDLSRSREDDKRLMEQLLEATRRHVLPVEPVPAPAPAQSARVVDEHEVECQKCGKRNPKQYKFCLGCGAGLSIPPARPTTPTLSSIPPRGLPIPPVEPPRYDSTFPRPPLSVVPPVASAPSVPPSHPGITSAPEPALAPPLVQRNDRGLNSVPLGATSAAPPRAVESALSSTVVIAPGPIGETRGLEANASESPTGPRAVESALSSTVVIAPGFAAPAPITPSNIASAPSNVVSAHAPGVAVQGEATSETPSAPPTRPSSLPIRGLPEPVPPAPLPPPALALVGAVTQLSPPAPALVGAVTQLSASDSPLAAVATTVAIVPAPVALQTVASAPPLVASNDAVAPQIVASAPATGAALQGEAPSETPSAPPPRAAESALSSTVAIAPEPIAETRGVEANPPASPIAPLPRAVESALSSTVVIAPGLAAPGSPIAPPTGAGVPATGAMVPDGASNSVEPASEMESSEGPLADSGSRSSSYPSADNDVQFTIYRPESIPPEIWRTLLVFVHKTRAEKSEDPDPAQTVTELAERVLGEAVAEYESTHQDAPLAIPRETEITLVPYASGVEFNPREHRFVWLEPVHHTAFRMRATAALDGQTIHGGVRVFMGILLVADVPLRIEVSSTTVEEPHQAVSASPLRRVFPSYSHADAAIVALCERCAEALGLQYLRDVRMLRAGERWSARLAERIRDANVFQLFWSTNSMRSPYVRAEWELALELGKRMCPVYWETPFPEAPNEDLPPSALRALHFVDLSGQRQAGEILVNDARELMAATLHSEAPPAVPVNAADRERRSAARVSVSTSSLPPAPAFRPDTERDFPGTERDLDELDLSIPAAKHDNWFYVLAFVCIVTLMAVLLYFVVTRG